MVYYRMRLWFLNIALKFQNLNIQDTVIKMCFRELQILNAAFASLSATSVGLTPSLYNITCSWTLTTAIRKLLLKSLHSFVLENLR